MHIQVTYPIHNVTLVRINFQGVNVNMYGYDGCCGFGNPYGGYGYPVGGIGFGFGGFALIVVLFILLIIIGASWSL
jgi:uncharacterized protein (TIGR01732 family)